MKKQSLSIGALSRLSGIPVRRLRFYEDQGLFPGSDRAASGYRLFSHADVIRADTIRLLRTSGMSLSAIKSALKRHSDIKALLRLRLGEIEATVASLARIGNTIREVIAREDMTQADIKRISQMIAVSNDERAEAIRRFVQTIEDDQETHPSYKNMIRQSFGSELPEDASDEQRQAWIELSELLQDRKILDDTLRKGRRYRPPTNPKAYFDTLLVFKERGITALANGLQPNSDEALGIAREFLSAKAAQYGTSPIDPDFLHNIREAVSKPPGMSRQYQLALKLMNVGPVGELHPALQWLNQAVAAYLAEPARSI